MPSRPTPDGVGSPGPESYARLLLNLGSVALALAALAFVLRSGPRRPAPSPVASVAAKAGPAPTPPTTVTPEPIPDPEPEEPPPPPAKGPDREAVAKAEGALDEASRDRGRAEARLAEAQRRLSDTTLEANAAAAAGRKLAFRVRDPSARIARLSNRGGFLAADRDRLKEEVAALKRAPRPKPKSIVDQNPVAKPAGGDEYHFEVRRDRVSFIDLDRLIKLVKADAQLRVRLADNMRVIESRVGPVGAFSMDYVLRRAGPRNMEDLVERRGVSFDLRGWELVPESDNRGETYERANQSFSEYARAVNRLSPERSTITMWVYPDGFPLYRKLRDDLHARGFLVAARPLPEGITIKGSPAGSLSAGQ